MDHTFQAIINQLTSHPEYDDMPRYYCICNYLFLKMSGMPSIDEITQMMEEDKEHVYGYMMDSNNFVYIYRHVHDDESVYDYKLIGFNLKNQFVSVSNTEGEWLSRRL